MIVAGTVINSRYEILRHIGRGGMQDVYEANDQILDIHVALKTPLQGQTAARFRNSAVYAARVNHHNVAKTFDYFEDRGVPYLIEEYVDGDTLENALLNMTGVIDPHVACHLFILLAKGICASHHAGVIHRDLKPSNVMVVDGFSLSSVKITDFGISTLTDSVFEEVVANYGDLTQSTSGTVRGALPYMAPEMMFRKKGDHPGTPSDIWSLGALMFKMLTGEYPFGTGFETPVNIRMNQRTAWPQFMTNNRQYAPLATEIQRQVERCLQQDEASRPTADQLVIDLLDICFYYAPRAIGVVNRLMYQGEYGFITAADGRTIFFNSDSTYGPTRTAVGSSVSFSTTPGTPYPRAHPLIVFRPRQ